MVGNKVGIGVMVGASVATVATVVSETATVGDGSGVIDGGGSGVDTGPAVGMSGARKSGVAVAAMVATMVATMGDASLLSAGSVADAVLVGVGNGVQVAVRVALIGGFHRSVAVGVGMGWMLSPSLGYDAAR